MDLCVLMAMYNGQKYVIEQLESIFAQQTECDIHVLIRDDGSADESVQVVRRYAEDTKHDIRVMTGKNLGPARSFLWLIQHCPEMDYYAFCDQDDVWLPGKVSAGIRELDVEKPVLWLSDYKVTDEKLNVIAEGFDRPPESNPAKILFYNNAPGRVMMFNRRLLELMRSLDLQDFRMHDIMALNLAQLFGKVVFCPEAKILYRQHQGNAIGYGRKRIRPFKWIREKVTLVKDGENYYISEYCRKLLVHYEDRLKEKDLEAFREIAGYNQSLISRIRLLQRDYTQNGFNRTSVSIRMRILLGLI